MRKYILTNTTNKKFKQLENKECEFLYSGGGATMHFPNESIQTSRVLKIEVNQENRNIYIKTKNSEYFLERVNNE